MAIKNNTDEASGWLELGVVEGGGVAGLGNPLSLITWVKYRAESLGRRVRSGLEKFT